MNNLLRKCENCVFSRKWKVTGDIECRPNLPVWVVEMLDKTYAPEIRPFVKYFEYVHSEDATACPAFRLRDTGVNE